MPLRQTQLVTNEFYHIVQRGVEKRDIFLDEEDFLRFVNSLLIFNDRKRTPWGLRAFWQQREQSSLAKNYKPSNPLVEIHAFALMKNHFHLLVRQIAENGITNFMRKLGGYAYYFNKKYQRVGPLFQGRFKTILIKTENQLRNTFVYIHTNPLEIIESDWKEAGIKNPKKAIRFLGDYQWSSYLDYLGRRNFPNVIYKDFFLKLFEGEKRCREEAESWILYKADIDKMRDIILE